MDEAPSGLAAVTNQAGDVDELAAVPPAAQLAVTGVVAPSIMHPRGDAA
jgi:hypothetical protein